MLGAGISDVVGAAGVVVVGVGSAYAWTAVGMATAMAASAATTPRDLVRVLTWLLEFFLWSRRIAGPRYRCAL
ncbi:exported hypothetical protein [uncultured Mycobacterium sp.]|uniref:Uncharacterized protein n=1 Tax=uncultured Mycobacterium sp. TaxID=171292 RepID=A0A1Y5PGY4_9MYCO|nr:exported hypothetical protein [uncultured Mycobacterium sp.]